MKPAAEATTSYCLLHLITKVIKMPYSDKEKQKAYMRQYRKKERELLKKLKLDSSVQKDAKQ